VRPRSGNAKTRAVLNKAGWNALSSSGAETWVDPKTNTLHPLVKAAAVERERNA
jgi:hypothetical protein